jgi:haloacetate dehalogenase
LATIDFTAFSRELITVAGGTVFVRRAGSGPVVLLLHGYPETHLAWRKVAPLLATRFTVVAADLPGYGDSTLSGDNRNAERISKRTMAGVLADLMTELGAPRFAVVGHDRGARVAYRLALDLPRRVDAIALLDIIPIVEMANRLTYASARQMAHWFWLAQPSTAPETLIGRDPELYLRHIVDAWGGSDVIERDALEEYLRCFRKPEVLRASGAEYRADQLDLEHDRADRAAGRRITCPLLALWAQGGLPEEFGDPLVIWRDWADDVHGCAIAGGHFMMEESPRKITALLEPFLRNAFHHHQPARTERVEVPPGAPAGAPPPRAGS